MVDDDRDAPFPQCCTRCPHLETVSAACTHRYRQTIVTDLEDDRPCPIFVVEKTTAMDRLTKSLQS